MTTDRGTPELAQSEYDTAAYLCAQLEADLEDAYIRQDSHAEKERISDMHGRAATLKSAALLRLVAARKAAAPSFEELLRDPTGQYDKDGIVLKSILDSQPFCATPMQVQQATASAAPPIPATYLCMKPKPCPDHGDPS